MSDAESVSVLVLACPSGAIAEQTVTDALRQRGPEVNVLVPAGTAAPESEQVSVLPVDRSAHPAVILTAALQAGCADWLAFAQAGDRWHPDHLQASLTRAESAGADWVYGSRVILDGPSEAVDLALAVRPDEVAGALRARNVIGGPSSILVRRDLVAIDPIFDPRLRALVYWAAWVTLADRRPACCPAPLVGERADKRASLISARVTVSELELLAHEPSRRVGSPPALLELAEAWRQQGRHRDAAIACAHSARLYRRPQDLLRAVDALRLGRSRIRAERPEAREPPAWLSAPPRVASARVAADRDRDPLVSVIIITRNRPRFAAQAVRSAAAQGIPLEVLVVDDASDDPGAVAALKQLDPRVRVLRQSRSRGAGQARNDGLLEARGQWVAFLDDDDLMAPNRLSTHLEQVGDAGFTFCGQLLVDGRRHVIGSLPAPRADHLAERLRSASYIGGPSAVVVRAELVREVGGFRAGLYALADWDLWLRLAARAPAVALPDLLIAYTVHPGNMHLTAPDRILADFRLFRKLHDLDELAEPHLLLWLAKELSAAGRHRDAAALHLQLALLRRGPIDLVHACRSALGRGGQFRRAEFEPQDWLRRYQD